jgi:hypothetical protein
MIVSAPTGLLADCWLRRGPHARCFAAAFVEPFGLRRSPSASLRTAPRPLLLCQAESAFCGGVSMAERIGL